jgi:hypothetical protein
MVIAKYEGLEAYIPMLGEAGVVGLSDLYDCPAAELERLAAQMKVPHAKLLRRLHASLLPPQGDEWASFVASRERTTQDLCRACSLSECAPRFIDEGYTHTIYFLDAPDAELEELLASLQPVDRRRLLRAIGRPVAPSRVAAAQAEEPPLDAFCVRPAAADEAFPASQSRTVRSLAKADPPLTSLLSFCCLLCLPSHRLSRPGPKDLAKGSFHACRVSVESCCNRVQVPDDLVQLLRENPGLEQYMPIFAAEGFTSLADVYDCPQLELDLILAKMKGPHARLMQRLCTSLSPPRGDEWTTFVHSRGRTTQDVLTACSLSEFVPRFSSEGYDFGGDLLAAKDAELEWLCASMRPAERRRLLRAVGRPVRSADLQEQHEQQSQIVAAEWARFVSTAGRTVGSLFKATGLSAFTQHFESEGYTIVPFLLDASMQELLAVSTPMKAVERQRLVRVLGRGLEVSAAAEVTTAAVAVDEMTEEGEKAEAEKSEAPMQQEPLDAAVAVKAAEEAVAEKAAAETSEAPEKQQEPLVAAVAAQMAVKATEEFVAEKAAEEEAEPLTPQQPEPAAPVRPPPANKILTINPKPPKAPYSEYL